MPPPDAGMHADRPLLVKWQSPPTLGRMSAPPGAGALRPYAFYVLARRVTPR
jgi:hypothetical protein